MQELPEVSGLARLLSPPGNCRLREEPSAETGKDHDERHAGIAR